MCICIVFLEFSGKIGETFCFVIIRFIYFENRCVFFKKITVTRVFMHNKLYF